MYNKNKKKSLQNVTKQTALEIVRKKASDMVYLPWELRNDRDIKLAAAAQNYQQVSSKEYADRDFLLVGVIQDPSIMVNKFIPNELKNDREIGLAAISRYGEGIKYLGDELKRNREFHLDAIEVNPAVLSYLNYLHDPYGFGPIIIDKQFIKDAVQRNGLALQFVDKILRNDPEIVMTAFRQNEHSLQFADKFVKNPEIFLMSMHLKGMYLTEVEKKRINDKIEEIFILENSLVSNIIPGTSKRLRNSTKPLHKLRNHGPHFKNLFLKRIKSYSNESISNKEMNIVKQFRQSMPLKKLYSSKSAHTSRSPRCQSILNRTRRLNTINENRNENRNDNINNNRNENRNRLNLTNIRNKCSIS